MPQGQTGVFFMARLTFAGGIYPYSGKEMTRDEAIQNVLPPEGELFYPLRQHIGAPAVSVVHIGDYVSAGQMIARADGELSAHVFSSVSGQVVAIEELPDIRNVPQECIVIRNDGTYREQYYPENLDYSRLSGEHLLALIRDAGIVGLGGSGLPTHYKLMTANKSTVNTVIANCVECEPYLTGDYRRILEDPWKVIGGLAICLSIFPKARGIIAVSESNREGYQLLRELLINNPRIYVQRCRDKYPQGSERQLIHAITGRTLNAKMLPYEIGCMVLNTETLVAINQAVLMQEPLFTRIITVSGQAAAHPCNLRVRCGETYRDVLEQAGGLRRFSKEGNTLFLAGGPLTGTEIQNLDAPVTKLSSSLICIPKRTVQEQKETPCIRCRRCTQVCPNQIVPMQLIRDVRADNKPAFVEHAGLECCDCGCCSYVCPAKINLSEEIGAMKQACLQNTALAGNYARRYQS